MVGARDEGVGEMCGQFLLNGVWSGGAVVDEAQTMCNAENVGVNGKGGLVEDDCLNDISCLASHAWKFDEVVEVVGHFTSEITHEHLRHTHEVGSLGVWITHTFDVFKDNLWRAGSHDLCRRECLEQGRRHEIHALVGALSREDDGNEQLKRVLILQLRLDFWHRSLKIVDERVVLFTFTHMILPLLDILAYLGQVALHTFLVLGVDDGDEFLHLRTNLLHLVLGVGVEENFA